MESPKTGILIIAMLGVFSLAGALAGWKFRQQAVPTINPVVAPANVAVAKSGGNRGSIRRSAGR